MTSNRALARQVGLALEHLRRERRLAQYMLADLAGMTKGMLSSYENGKQCPSLLSLVKLLAAMGISWQHFGRALATSERPRPPGGQKLEHLRIAND
jgi:transcriptional regulator with XRE-family HTH domain